ncbi:hypothetical protein FC89_GL000269 [Liquorilactobacillus ghanensis DSM 18630]|uniref:Peptidase S74 domain-containing protein n=1 Tax=Liquorilactobacillus ghanensis DSM 18630 TaxID=1423750 RepID=A0A0R1VMD9_9LACO|nr:hypothetical protein [Liquorilactobacillus ghanensis]KRM06960.1 hypothetical protein FC89_GL000269 [Liquorilactobacillus ghanensis DSM 18630]
MITQSDAALAAWRATERTLDAKVVITDSNGKSTEYGTADITSIGYDSGAWTGDTFSIGSTYENNITVAFAHLVEGLKQGFKVTAKIGIKLPDGTYEYAPLGIFIISDEITMDRNNDATTVKAYDQMCVMQGTYTSKLTYPAKVVDVIAEIANMAGVALNTDDIARLPVLQDLPSSITGQSYCTAIGWIAQFYGGFATFDRDGKLTIRQVTDASYTLDPSQYLQAGLTKNEATYQIGGIQCQVTTTTKDSTGESSENTTTLQAGSTAGSQIQITNNLMTQDRLDAVWNSIKDITFYPYSLTWFGNPAVEAGDWLTLQDTKGNKFNVPNNSYTMTFDGSLSATSKADQTSTSSSSYSYSGTLSQVVKQLAGRQGATGNYIYGTDITVAPANAKIGDLWYKQNGNKVEMWLYEKQPNGTGKWIKKVDDLTGTEISEKVNTAMSDANVAKQNANNAVETGNQALAKAQTGIDTANAAADKASDASVDANKAINDSASAIAQAQQAANDASTVIDQAQQIANSLTTLQNTVSDNSSAISKAQKDINTAQSNISQAQTDLATAKKDITTNANAIKDANGNISLLQTSASKFQNSITDVQGDISILQQDSTSFKSEIGSLQADNGTNKQNISILQNTVNGFNSTVAQVQQQVNDSAVGTNLLLGTGTSYTANNSGGATNVNNPMYVLASDLKVNDKITVSFDAVATANAPIQIYKRSDHSGDGIWDVLGTVNVTTKVQHYSFQYTMAHNWNKVDYLGFRLDSVKTIVTISHMKLELGSHATPWCLNPNEQATVTQISTLSNTVDGLSSTVSKKANQSDLNLTSTQLSNLSNTVNGLSSTVASKANNSDLQSTETKVSNLQNTINGLDTTVSSVQSTANQTKTDVTTLKQQASGFQANITSLQQTKADQSWTTNQINATSNSLKVTIADIQGQVNDSAVGTNLLLGTGTSYTANNSGGATNVNNPMYVLASDLKVNDKITVSFDAVATANAPIQIYKRSDHSGDGIWDVLGTVNVTTKVQHYSFQYTMAHNWNKVDYLGFRLDSVKTIVTISHMKLELGSHATPWCLNPNEQATVTQISTLSNTIDGLSATVSKKVDTTTFTSYQTQTATAIADKVSSSTFNSYKTQTDSAIQSKVSSADYNTKVTQLSNMINSKVSQSDWTNSAVGENLVPNSNADTSGLPYGYNSVIGKHSFYNGGKSYLSIIHNTSSTAEKTSGGQRFFITAGQTYTLSFKAFNNGLLSSTDVWLLGRPNSNTTDDYTVAQQLVTSVKFSTSGIQYYKTTFTVKLGIENAYLRFDNNGTTANGSSADLYFNEVKIEKGEIATPWCPAASEIANYSQIQQLSDNINLRVQKNDVINQINVSSESILIAGNKVHITGQTTIDNAVIKSAMIDSLSADKITAGTLNAANVNIVNMNANNISTGTLTADRISGGTLTGVSFHQSSNNNQTWIDNNGIHNYDNSNESVWIKNGLISVAGGIGNNIYLGGYNASMILADNNTKQGNLVIDSNYGIALWSDYDLTTLGGKGTRYGGIDFDKNYGMSITSEYAINFLCTENGSTKASLGLMDGSLIVNAAITTFYGSTGVTGDLSVTGSKNAIVETSAGWARINAYETAEYYFGDIGETQTGSGCEAKIMMDSLFLETVNTSVGYQVFITPYSNAKIWVDERNLDNFVVKSDTPNAKFSYEIKAKRKGYENVRLEIDKDFRKEAA